MVQAGRTVHWAKQKCGAITYDYAQQTYKIKSSISDLSSDIPFDKSLAWPRTTRTKRDQIVVDSLNMQYTQIMKYPKINIA